MKRTVLAAIFLAMLLATTARAGSLFPGHIESGGFLAPVVKGSEFHDDTEVFLGGRGGWILDHKLVLGAGIYTMVSDVIAQNTEGLDRVVKFTYGGLELEYVFFNNSVVHPTISVLTGLGGIKLRDPVAGSEEDPDSDSVFVLEPGLHLVLNLTDFARFTMGGGYRYVSGVDLAVFSNADAEGAFGMVTLKLGMF